jgi:hypothetical protein
MPNPPRSRSTMGLKPQAQNTKPAKAGLRPAYSCIEGTLKEWPSDFFSMGCGVSFRISL